MAVNIFNLNLIGVSAWLDEKKTGGDKYARDVVLDIHKVVFVNIYRVVKCEYEVTYLNFQNLFRCTLLHDTLVSSLSTTSS